MKFHNRTDINFYTYLGKTDSLTFGGAPKCSEEANCDTPIVYETGFVTVLQYKRYNAYEMQKDARAKIINLVFENFCVLCLSLSCIMDTMATEE